MTTHQKERRLVWEGKICPDCGSPLVPPAWRGSWKHRCVDCQKKHRKAYRVRIYKEFFKRIKEEALEVYGSKCRCCGEATPEFLAFDHISNNGAAHRRILPKGSQGGYRLAHWLKRHNWPSYIQLLCHNCNCAKAWYGVCPHQEVRHDGLL